MGRVYVFADEAGNLDFKRAPGASRYFILGTVTLTDLDFGNQLLTLRRELAWQGIALESFFHASEDPQLVRDEVFRALSGANFRFDATLLEKPKTQDHLRKNSERFYKLAWFLHFKYVAPLIVNAGDELLVIAASLGTRKRRTAIRIGIADVVNQSAGWCQNWQVASWPAESDPCLQVADYCTWALQRKYELGDTRSYDLIKSKVLSEFQPFASSPKSYY